MNAVAKPAKRITKKARLDRVREIIDNYPLDVPFSAADTEEIAELTQTNVSLAIRRRNPGFPKDTRHLHVVAYDWAEPGQWSWRKAIEFDVDRSPEESRAARERQNYLRALRFAIRPDLRDFLDAQWPSECCACGGREDLTADHAGRPFISIALEFLGNKGRIDLRPVPGNNDLIACADVEAEWIAFHAARATYAVLCRSCNASKGARGSV